MKLAIRLFCLAALGALPTLATTVDPLRAGAPAPGFELKSNSGKPVSLSSLKGQIVLVNFWASWCGPCRKEMPILEQLNHQYHNKGVTLVGVNVEPDSGAANDWLKATPVSFPILFDVDSKVSKLTRWKACPTP